MKPAAGRKVTQVGTLATILTILGVCPAGVASPVDAPHLIQPDSTAGGAIGRIIRHTYPEGGVVTNQAGAIQYIVKANAGGNGFSASPDGLFLVVPGSATWDGNYVVQFWQKNTSTFGWAIGQGYYKEVTIPANQAPTNPWVRGNLTFAACTPDSKYVWLVDQTTKSLIRLTLTSTYVYDWNDPLRGTTQAKGLPDIVVTDTVHLVEPRQIAFGRGNGHAYPDMYIANGSAYNVVVYDGSSGAYVKTITLPAKPGTINWCGALLADADYLYVHLGRKSQNSNNYLVKYDFSTGAFTPTPLIDGDNTKFTGVWHLQWAPEGKIVHADITPAWGYAVKEFDPKTGQSRDYFTPKSGAPQPQTFAFYFVSPPPQGTILTVR